MKARGRKIRFNIRKRFNVRKVLLTVWQSFLMVWQYSLMMGNRFLLEVQRVPILLRCFLMVVLCLSTACSSFKELSLFKSKGSNKEKLRERSSGQSLLFDYSEAMRRDSSSFQAWILVDGDFSLHKDSGIKGEKAFIQYAGKHSSVLFLKDSLITQHDSSRFVEHTASETSFVKMKEKKRWGYSWLLWVGGGLVVLWLYLERGR